MKYVIILMFIIVSISVVAMENKCYNVSIPLKDAYVEGECYINDTQICIYGNIQLGQHICEITYEKEQDEWVNCGINRVLKDKTDTLIFNVTKGVIVKEVNVTVEKEVPTYVDRFIDRNVTVEVPKEIYIEKTPMWCYVVTTIMGVFMLWLIWRVITG